jgi:iron-sulfur cluster repair protein YtfE (RIC family)
MAVKAFGYGRNSATMIGNETSNNKRPSSGWTGTAEVYVRFAQLLDAQARVCDELEDLADRLPDSVDSQSCLRTAQQLLPVVKTAHDFEDNILFPLLEAQTHYMVEMRSTIERLRFEHWGDQEFAEDVRHALREFVRQREKANIDSLAWMLRGFFESMRRHIAFDREYLLPIVKSVSVELISKGV